jgi:hypothetical protein
MADSIYEFVLQRLEKAKRRWPEVAEGSGVPLRSLEKIARQEWTNPGIQSIEKLAAYFRDQEQEPELH